MRRLLVFGGVAAVVVSVLVGGSPGPERVQASHGNVNVHVHDTYFDPAGAFATEGDAVTACLSAAPAASCDAQIHTGDSVTWVTTAAPAPQAPHTVTECSDGTFSTCSAIADPNSPINDNATVPVGPVTFTAAGTYFYRCNIHPDVMRGRVVVAQAQTPSPTPTPLTTGTPTATPSGTPTRTPTVTPAAVPVTGGPQDGSSGSVWTAVLIALAAALATGGVLVFQTARRR